MNRAEIIGRTRRRVEIARGWGVPVVYTDGWTARGRDGLVPRVIVEHCTSDPHILSTDRMRQILQNGHGAISGNAICTDWVRRDAVVEVLASGLCWHAGSSSWQGLSSLNRWALGTEYHRAQSQELTSDQLRVGLLWTRAGIEAFEISTTHVCEHSECGLPRGRKVDRRLTPSRSMDGRQWRQDLAFPPANTTVITTGSTGPDVHSWQATLDRLYPNDRAAGFRGPFEAETVTRTLMAMRAVGLTPADPARPQVGSKTRQRVDQLLREPWAGMLVQARPDLSLSGVRMYDRAGWHPEVTPIDILPKGWRIQGGIVRKIRVGRGWQYEAFTRGNRLPRYITAHENFVRLVRP